MTDEYENKKLASVAERWDVPFASDPTLETSVLQRIRREDAGRMSKPTPWTLRPAWAGLWLLFFVLLGVGTAQLRLYWARAERAGTTAADYRRHIDPLAWAKPFSGEKR